MLALRDELRVLVSDWDRRLEKTPKGSRAQLLEALGSSTVIEKARRNRRS